MLKSMEIAIRVGDTTVFPTNVVKNLGVILDSEMSMQPRVKQVVKSSYFHLRAISRIRRHFDETTCASIVQAIVISRLDYANSLLVGLPESTLRKLQLIQNNAARLITRTRYRDHITPVLRKLHWLPIHSRITHKLVSLVYKSLNVKKTPTYIRDMIQVNHPRRALRSCAEVRLIVPKSY